MAGSNFTLPSELVNLTEDLPSVNASPSDFFSSSKLSEGFSLSPSTSSPGGQTLSIHEGQLTEADQIVASAQSRQGAQLSLNERVRKAQTIARKNGAASAKAAGIAAAESIWNQAASLTESLKQENITDVKVFKLSGDVYAYSLADLGIEPASTINPQQARRRLNVNKSRFAESGPLEYYTNVQKTSIIKRQTAFYQKRGFGEHLVCAYCHQKLTTAKGVNWMRQVQIEHVEAITGGGEGKNNWWNTVIACGECNNLKSDHTLEEFVRRFNARPKLNTDAAAAGQERTLFYPALLKEITALRLQRVEQHVDGACPKALQVPGNVSFNPAGITSQVRKLIARRIGFNI